MQSVNLKIKLNQTDIYRLTSTVEDLFRLTNIYYIFYQFLINIRLSTYILKNNSV